MRNWNVQNPGLLVTWKSRDTEVDGVRLTSRPFWATQYVNNLTVLSHFILSWLIGWGRHYWGGMSLMGLGLLFGRFGDP